MPQKKISASKRKTKIKSSPRVGIIMGSSSDWNTMKDAAQMLDKLNISYETKIVSAHRTPALLYKYAQTAHARGIRVIIAGAGGAAHLPGMTAAMTHLPVLGVPIQSKSLNGLDSLLSIAQMPGGIPVLTLAIGSPGALNAALSAGSILALSDEKIREKIIRFRNKQTNKVLKTKLPKN